MVLESIWFISAVLIVTIVLLVDPKSSSMGSGNSSVLRALQAHVLDRALFTASVQ
jgi:preprotein translocase subunit SecG